MNIGIKFTKSCSIIRYQETSKKAWLGVKKDFFSLPIFTSREVGIYLVGKRLLRFDYSIYSYTYICIIKQDFDSGILIGILFFGFLEICLGYFMQ